MIKYIKGDLLESTCDVIAHGVNCSGGFGSGIAGQIRQRWPDVWTNYGRKFMTPGWKLGDVQFVKCYMPDRLFLIANCATQQYYGKMAKHGVVYVSYPAVERVMIELYEYHQETGADIAIPKIGAGLAGGDWAIIESIIGDVFHDADINVYYL